jgi:hypothetical protein
MTATAMAADSRKVRDTASMSDFKYNVPSRGLPTSATGSRPITYPCSKR